jgi:hypothetical protein
VVDAELVGLCNTWQVLVGSCVDEKAQKRYQHAYNRAKHSSTQTSPFEACFGYLPKSPLDFIFGKDIAIDGQYDIDRAEKFIEQI